ncbi:LysR family transcriptional regulator [Ponticoccus sp. SC2-23]|uniref:LysR family transcriptional regulator n=1 Tax=Alexandriicola marinus TaxID=2081710 RepID=UPI000FD7938C|nr:LysR family transcriptional regulator [Alexandriicola marinus]MBM1219710.1 LysR family transcriptional regulator [Ponticoccus sp. SC6-9]MBM1223218.1 LysR family transcriptional regulator [Ponticoccus sp. SC6-15]MBM1229523.1 LysR family transcriptional regulator [Ponticoccus sp. SC6-38]MBM1232184.1 LysR family transcriptional regulator [Ponticoccus sp. SC6-45]MBM1237866.1 LysR family transcriptional regulator [Ponticoccus sp. SC6-49]MBM1241195.1 LysR family transcriptional regulator [Pontic
MPRNLDLTALRAFVTVAECGGVTKAAGLLNLTQSAVSMQLKRLEDSLGASLLDRSGRGIGLTASGEQLLGFGRRMLELNDQAFARLTGEDYEGEIVLGVPHDIIYPYIPPILRRFAAEYPRMQIKLFSAPTRRLREMFAHGDCDVILTTEDEPGPGGETLVRLPLVWIGAEGGTAWRQRPLPIAFCSNCIFRSGVLRRVNEANVPWRMVVESALDNAVDAAVSADLAISAAIEGGYPPQTAAIEHKGALPDPGETGIVLYMAQQGTPVAAALRDMIRSAYRAGGPGSAAELARQLTA